MARPPSRLADLLELENDPGFLQLACPDTGVLAWPAIRNQVLRQLMSGLLYGAAIGTRDGATPPAARAAALARALAHNAAVRPRRSAVLILASGAGLIERDGRSFNRYTDHFADSLDGDSWTLEGLVGWRWPERPRGNRRLTVTAPAEALALAAARAAVRDRHRAVARALVDLVEQRARALLDWTPPAGWREPLVERGARRLAGYPIRRRLVRRWLARVGPRLLLAEEGCYGHMAVVNATAREHGVTVAELQHGWVGRGHDAYNVAPLLAGSDAYRRTQPHAFLGYGDWGNRLFNAPVDRVAIGNPHRDRVLADLPPPPARRRDLLVLGDGVDTALMLAFCAELAGRAPAGLQVRFRPHPLERARVAAGGQPSAFAIDVAPDIHASLAAAHAVVAEVSTGLFDAVGLAERVFVWATAKSRFVLGEHPFAEVDSAADLADKLADPAAGALSRTDAASIWATGWRTRFLQYVAGVIPPD